MLYIEALKSVVYMYAPGWLSLCTVRGDAVGSWSRLGAAGRGDRRHGAAAQAGAQHADVDGEGGQETTKYARGRPQSHAVARTRQTQARRRHTGVELSLSTAVDTVPTPRRPAYAKDRIAQGHRRPRVGLVRE